MNDAEALQLVDSVALFLGMAAVVVGLVYVRRTIRLQREAWRILDQTRATYLELARRLREL